MKNVILGVALAVSAFAFSATAADARDFRCTGRTFSGDSVSVTGTFFGNDMVEDVYVTRNGQYVYYWDWPNVNITKTNTFWTVTGVEPGATLVIRHPEFTQNQTYMRIDLGWEMDNEFTRATCTFWN
jgi:hypothetical protein